ncbi:MAG: BrnT family toxin [Burkholderiales bacterium]
MEKPNVQREWDERKRQSNLAKHGLDFADAAWVLESAIRFDLDSSRRGEVRTQSMAYVFDRLAVLSVAHVPGDAIRILSFRKASTKERTKYHEWLAQDDA